MKILKYIIIIILAYIVISLTIARTLVTIADSNKIFLEQYVNKKLGTNIAVNNIEGNWKGLYPSLKINFEKDRKDKSKNYSYPDYVHIHKFGHLYLSTVHHMSFHIRSFYPFFRIVFAVFVSKKCIDITRGASECRGRTGDGRSEGGE